MEIQFGNIQLIRSMSIENKTNLSKLPFRNLRLHHIDNKTNPIRTETTPIIWFNPNVSFKNILAMIIVTAGNAAEIGTTIAVKSELIPAPIDIKAIASKNPIRTKNQTTLTGNEISFLARGKYTSA